MYQKFKKLGKDSMVYMAGTLISKLIGFALIPVYTRIFSPQDYGILDIVSISSVIIITVSNLGLTTALSIFYFQTEDQNNKKTFISSNFIFSIFINVLICALVIIFSRPLAITFLKNADYAKYLILSVLAIPFSAIINFGSGLFRLGLKPIKYFYIILGNSLFGVVLSIYLVIFRKMGLQGALLSLLISSIIFAVISIYLTKHHFNWKFSSQKLKLMLKVGLPLAPASFMVWIMDSSGRYFLAHFRTMSDIGLYSLGFKFASILVLITAAFRLANAPFQLSIASEAQAKTIYAKTLTYYLLMTFFVAAGLSMFSKEILSLLTSPDYINSYKIIPPLTFSFIADGIYQIVGIGLLISRKTQYMTYGVIAGALAALGFNALLAPRWGILGVAFATLLAYAVGLVLIYFWNQKYYHINFELKKIFKLLIFSLGFIILSFLSYFLLTPLPMIIFKSFLMIILGLIFYFSLEINERNKIWFLARNIFRKIKFRLGYK